MSVVVVVVVNDDDDGVDDDGYWTIVRGCSETVKLHSSKFPLESMMVRTKD